MGQVDPDSTLAPSRRNLFAGVMCIPFMAPPNIPHDRLSTLARLDITISSMAAAADVLGTEYGRLERACFQCVAPADSMTAPVAAAEAAHDQAEQGLADALDLFAGIRAITIRDLILKAKWAGRSTSVAESIVSDLMAMGERCSAGGGKLQAS